jgi:NADPH:quinone reductase
MTELPSTMRAVVAPTPGGPEALILLDRPRPEPREGEILIRVAAAGVNRPDILQRQGYYAPMPGVTDILGLEIAGEVVARGLGAALYEEGARVLALVPGGGYAQYCLAHESHALPVPQTLSPIEAAAIPETYFTVWHNVFERCRLAAGETLLVHGGSSGIGTTAIQLAKAFGARVSRLPDRRKSAPPASGSARTLRLTTETKISSPRPRRRPANEAPTSSST